MKGVKKKSMTYGEDVLEPVQAPKLNACRDAVLFELMVIGVLRIGPLDVGVPMQGSFEALAFGYFEVVELLREAVCSFEWGKADEGGEEWRKVGKNPWIGFGELDGREVRQRSFERKGLSDDDEGQLLLIYTPQRTLKYRREGKNPPRYFDGCCRRTGSSPCASRRPHESLASQTRRSCRPA